MLKSKRRSERDRLSVHARGHGFGGRHLEGSRGPAAARALSGIARLVEHQDSHQAAVQLPDASPAPADAQARMGYWIPARRRVRVDDTEVVDEGHSRQFRARTEHFRSRLEQRARLRAAIALPLHGGAVDAERHVVEKRATVHLADVDRAFDRLGERIEGANEIVRRHTRDRGRSGFASPPETQTSGSPWAQAADATTASDPSPPAIPRASAPSATASSTSAAEVIARRQDAPTRCSVPGPPRQDCARAALPPPDLG